MSLESSSLHLMALLADCYTPMLLLIALVHTGRYWRRGEKFHVGFLLFAACVVYAWMFIDARFFIWADKGLDYSTHTAAAFALAVYITLLTGRLPMILMSLIGYGYLMYLLNYHSWDDMISNLCVVAITLAPMIYLYLKRSQHLKSDRWRWTARP